MSKDDFKRELASTMAEGEATPIVKRLLTEEEMFEVSGGTHTINSSGTYYQIGDSMYHQTGGTFRQGEGTTFSQSGGSYTMSGPLN